MTLHHQDLKRYYPKTDERIREALAADVAFDHLLALMAQHQLFDVCDLVFKGGTAFRKYRFDGTGRLSTDLDFDGAPGADALIAEEIDGQSLSGFEFSISERRGFYTVHIRTPFDIEIATKMDFSTRGLWLYPETVAPRPVAIHNCYDIAPATNSPGCTACARSTTPSTRPSQSCGPSLEASTSPPARRSHETPATIWGTASERTLRRPPGYTTQDGQTQRSTATCNRSDRNRTLPAQTLGVLSAVAWESRPFVRVRRPPRQVKAPPEAVAVARLAS